MNTRDLERGALCKIDVNVEGEVLEGHIMTYEGMDGAYGKFYSEEHGLLNARGEHKKVGDYREFI